MNPLFNRKFFVPDPEAHKMPDGRLYVYGSLDISGANAYCSPYHRVYSTNDPKLEKWTDHGVAFSNTQENNQIYWKNTPELSAPDAIHKDGKYYLYVCSSKSQMEGVAVSDTPYGPFTDAQSMNCADNDGVWGNIDPSVFVDDDGSAYYFWGQFNLRGAKLNSDMRSLDESTINRNILTEKQHGFHEGSSIRKRGDKYYLVYADISRGKATCLSYAMADKPLGPYEKKGVIIDNIYCDPQTWNNHGSIEEYKGQWYVFYHRSSQNSIYNRRCCAEKIYFNDDGTINEVEMTSHGPSDPICAFQTIDASIACRVKGNCYIGVCEEGVNGEALLCCGGGNWTVDWAEYKYLNFEDGANLVTVRAKGKGTIGICTQFDEKLGEISIACNEYTDYTFSIKKVNGVKPIWITFDGKDMSLISFGFKKTDK